MTTAENPWRNADFGALVPKGIRIDRLPVDKRRAEFKALVNASRDDGRFNLLGSRERFILRIHYLLEDQFVPSWEIGRQLRISRKKVRKMEQKALGKLRRAQKSTAHSVA